MDVNMDSGTLTAQDVWDWLEGLQTKPASRCAHVVHPAELKRGGWAICANCFSPVLVPTGTHPSEGTPGTGHTPGTGTA